jgi:hypothetical protein
MDVVAHDDVFPQGTDDDVWLARAGSEGWVVLTKDQGIQKRPNELAAVVSARVRQFVLVDVGLTAPQMAGVLIRARKAMERLLRRRNPPFIASITKNGTLSRRVHPRRSL